MSASEPASFALRIDLQRMVPWDEWPVERSGPVRVTLVHAGSAMLLQPGRPIGTQPVGLTAGFVFSKPLAVASQPFELLLQQATGPAEWPWPRLFAWSWLTALAMGALAAAQRGQRARRRAEELLRVGQVARLNSLGELAGGMAHEINQPLAALLAGMQAARRLLDDDPPAIAAARQAIVQAAAQARRATTSAARRAADVVARLRRLVERPDGTQLRRPIRLGTAVRQMIELLDPELRGRGIETVMKGQGVDVVADPVALEQIVHNLLSNAMRALEDVPEAERRLVLQVLSERGRGVLTVRDSGPGIPQEAMPRLFEPFYTTRRGGLGLGLSLSETLAQSMDGTLTAGNTASRGAEFRLELPLARTAA